MKKFISITLLFLFLFISSNLASAFEIVAFKYPHTESLTKAGLNDEELSKIRGQGFEVPVVKDTKFEEARIILWDEKACGITKVNLSTGYGNFQSNTLSATGR